jgi:hypothetical protein
MLEYVLESFAVYMLFRVGDVGYALGTATISPTREEYAIDDKPSQCICLQRLDTVDK